MEINPHFHDMDREQNLKTEYDLLILNQDIDNIVQMHLCSFVRIKNVFKINFFLDLLSSDLYHVHTDEFTLKYSSNERASLY